MNALVHVTAFLLSIYIRLVVVALMLFALWGVFGTSTPADTEGVLPS